MATTKQLKNSWSKLGEPKTWQGRRGKRKDRRIWSVLPGQDSNMRWLWEGRNVKGGFRKIPRFLTRAGTLIEASNTKEGKIWEAKTMSLLGHVEMKVPRRLNLEPDEGRYVGLQSHE